MFRKAIISSKSVLRRHFATESNSSVPPPPPPPYDKKLNIIRWVSIVSGISLLTFLMTLPRDTYDSIDEINPNVPKLKMAEESADNQNNKSQ